MLFLTIVRTIVGIVYELGKCFGLLALVERSMGTHIIEKERQCKLGVPLRNDAITGTMSSPVRIFSVNKDRKK